MGPHMSGLPPLRDLGRWLIDNPARGGGRRGKNPRPYFFGEQWQELPQPDFLRRRDFHRKIPAVRATIPRAAML